MAEDISVKKQTKVGPPVSYEIKNVVRRQQSRLRRAATPGRQRFKQFVAGRRLLRNQKTFLNPSEMDMHGEAVLEGVRRGVFEMVDLEGWKYAADIYGSVWKTKGTVRKLVSGKRKSIPVREEIEVRNSIDVKKSDSAPQQPSQKVEAVEDNTSVKDDLTELQGIGPGRARKLESKGITSFVKLAGMNSGELAVMLGANVTVDQASELISAAKERIGG